MPKTQHGWAENEQWQYSMEELVFTYHLIDVSKYDSVNSMETGLLD